MAAMGLHHNSILLRIVSVCVLAVIGVVSRFQQAPLLRA
jgi:hypothetical protein